jgi:hypothetical protein
MVHACLILLTVLALSATARAAATTPTTPTTASERGRIQAQIERLTSALEAEESACKQRFVVTSCIEDVRLRRREALGPLRSQLLALDDEDRRQRANARLAAIETKRQEQRARLPEVQEPEKPRAVPSPRPAASVPLTAVRREQAAARQVAASAAAAQRVQAAKRRQQEADLHAAQVRQKLLEHQASGKAAAPLPVPAASR